MNRIAALAVLLLLSLGIAAVAVPTPALAQAPAGITFDSDAVEIGIGGRVHTQFNTTSVESEPQSEIIIRRARLEIDVKLNDVVTGAIAPEFGLGRVSLKDAYMKLNLSPAFEILAGKAFKPFSLIEQTSSTRMLTVERGAAIRGFEALDEYALVHDLEYSDRDIGLQVMGQPAGLPLGFAYQAGVFQGPLQGRVGEEQSYQYAARATVEPLPDLTLGAGWSSRHFAEGRPGDDGFQLDRGHAFEIDAELGSFSPGLHILAEVAFGDADAVRDAEFFGAHLLTAYRTEPISPAITAIEPVFRVSYGDVDEQAALGTGVTLLTPGVNIYFGGRNRVMFNYDVFLPHGGGDAEGSFKTMFALAF